MLLVAKQIEVLSREGKEKDEIQQKSRKGKGAGKMHHN